MAKLSKASSKAHSQAVEMLQQAKLNYDEKCFVLDNWQESATHMNGVAGAFFTPRGLARDFAHEVTGDRILDMCAGIGSLAFAYHQHHGGKPQITCVEINPEYAAVGIKILPEATWICGDVFDAVGACPTYDCAISNPPYGNVKTRKNNSRLFEYDLIEHASKLSRDGVFLIPQNRLPFCYSGQDHFFKTTDPEYEKFSEKTGITLSMNCGFDTSTYREEWKGLRPPVLEIALGYRKEE